jgi:hypothetical protein
MKSKYDNSAIGIIKREENEFLLICSDSVGIDHNLYFDREELEELRDKISEVLNMKMQILNWLIKHDIPYQLGQVKGGFESIKIPYGDRAEFIEHLRKNKVKMIDIIYSDDMEEVTLIFEKGSKL